MKKDMRIISSVVLGIAFIPLAFALVDCGGSEVKWPTSSNPAMQEFLTTVQSVDSACSGPGAVIEIPSQAQVDRTEQQCSDEDLKKLVKINHCMLKACNGELSKMEEAKAACKTLGIGVSVRCQASFKS